MSKRQLDTRLKRYRPWALVTGSSSGIGAEFCRQLARTGINIVLTARRKDRLDALAAQLREAFGVETRCIPLDLEKGGATEELDRETGDLDVGLLVNNAGFGGMGLFRKQDPDRLESMIRLNCIAPMRLTHRFLERMEGRERSGIIIVASVSGYQGSPYMSCYGGTKGFDLLFGEALASEMAGEPVDILVASPGSTRSEFHQVADAVPHPAADPEDVVAEALGALGKKHTVACGLGVKLQASAYRFFPRRFVTFSVRQILRRLTPPEKR